LSYDLKDQSTSVHLLVPGWTFTNLVSSAVRTPKLPTDVFIGWRKGVQREAGWSLDT
jgi:hypothetical protein